MELAKALDRALGLEIIFEQRDMIDRNIWMTADEKLLRQIAYSKSRKAFWRGIAGFAKEMADDNLYKVATAGATGELEENDTVRDIIRSLRREARRYATDRGLAPMGAIDAMGMDPEEIKRIRASIEKAQADDQRKYPGDELYGVFGKDGKLIKGGFYNTPDAESYVHTELPEVPEGEYEIKLYENPKSLSKLKNIKLPLEKGWTVDEVVHAFMPWIKYQAWKWHSDKSPYEDLIQHGAIGVINALRTDKGEAPIGSHAWRHIMGEIRRAAMTGGVVTSTEKPGAAVFGQAGVLIGYEVKYTDEKGDPVTKFFPSNPKSIQNYFAQKTGRTPPRTQDPSFIEAQRYRDELVAGGVPEDRVELREKRGKLASTEAPLGGEGRPTALGATIKGRALRPEAMLAQPDLVKFLMDKAKLSDKQKEVVGLLFGLDVPEASSVPPRPEGEEHEPGQQAGMEPEKFVDPETGKVIRTVSRGAEKEMGGRSVIDVAKLTNKSPKAVRVLRDRAMMALHDAAQDYAAELKAKGLIQKPSELAQSEDALKKAKPICEFFRNQIIESIVNGEINYLFD